MRRDLDRLDGLGGEDDREGVADDFGTFRAAASRKNAVASVLLFHQQVRGEMWTSPKSNVLDLKRERKSVLEREKDVE